MFQARACPFPPHTHHIIHILALLLILIIRILIHILILVYTFIILILIIAHSGRRHSGGRHYPTPPI